MSNKKALYEVGQIIKNSQGEYTKILAIYEGTRFALTGWSNLENAKKSTIAVMHLNIFGMENCEVEITDEVSDVSTTEDADTAPTKKSLKALDVEELTALAGTLSIEIDEADKKGDILEKLYTHYKL